MEIVVNVRVLVDFFIRRVLSLFFEGRFFFFVFMRYSRYV